MSLGGLWSSEARSKGKWVRAEAEIKSCVLVLNCRVRLVHLMSFFFFAVIPKGK